MRVQASALFMSNWPDRGTAEATDSVTSPAHLVVERLRQRCIPRVAGAQDVAAEQKRQRPKPASAGRQHIRQWQWRRVRAGAGRKGSARGCRYCRLAVRTQLTLVLDAVQSGPWCCIQHEGMDRLDTSFCLVCVVSPSELVSR